MTGTPSARLLAIKTELLDAEAALGRLVDGTYGQCACCRASIAAKRLEALPGAARCASCADLA